MKNILEPSLMSNIFVPSLESIAIVNVVTVVCKQSDIRDTIQQHSLEFDPVGSEVRGSKYDRSFIQIEKNIFHKLSLLPLPKLLKTKVTNIVRPIQLQILEWIRSDRKDIEYMDSIYWTSEGVIDKVKTLKQLIEKDTGKHIHGIFKSACMYCLEENIPQLWDQLPNNIKNSYLQSGSLYKKYDTHLIAYWIHTINNELPGLFSKIKKSCDSDDIYNFKDGIHRNIFSLVLWEGNILAVKYFWNKLTDVEIYGNLERWIGNVVECKGRCYSRYQHIDKNADILYFLLSKLSDKTQQKEILQRNSNVILKSLFFDWPWQRFLLPTMQVMSKFIDNKVFIKLISIVATEIKENKTTEKLLKELWYVSSVTLKKCFIKYLIDDYRGTDMLCNLLIVEDVGTIELILGYANIADKKQVIFSLVEKNINLLEVIYAGKLPLFDDVLKDILSESDINNIKESIVCKHGNRLCHKWICDNNWIMVDIFINWAFNSQDKIDYFKNETINKIDITYSILYQGNYELVNKFMEWCFDSKEEICEFKIYFAESKPKIVNIGCYDWQLFEKFLGWCFDSDQEINDYKSYILHSHEVGDIIVSNIAYGYDFEFIDNLINWCCFSDKVIKHFKAEFVLSTKFMVILEKFVRNYKVYDSEWNNWELIKKLMKLFSPLEEDVITRLKIKIPKCINFYDFYRDYKKRSYAIKKEDLFCLLDNDSYNIGDVKHSTDSYQSSDYTDSDDDHCTTSYYDDCVIVLTEILNKVESSLL